MLYQVIKKFQAIRESSEIFDENTEIRQGTIYDMYLLLHSLEIGAIDFRQFLDESVKWSQQVLDAKKQKETTSTE